MTAEPSFFRPLWRDWNPPEPSDYAFVVRTRANLLQADREARELAKDLLPLAPSRSKQESSATSKPLISPKPVSRLPKTPITPKTRNVVQKFSDEQAREWHVRYLNGESMNEIMGSHWKELGYKHVGSAGCALNIRFHKLGLHIRTAAEAKSLECKNKMKTQELEPSFVSQVVSDKIKDDCLLFAKSLAKRLLTR